MVVRVTTAQVSIKKVIGKVTRDSAFEGHHNVDDLCKIATLAEKFGLTSFKEYQKKVIP